MKYKKILLFSGIALPASVLLRFLQLVFTVDTKTGFFKSEYKETGYYLLILIIVCAAVTAALCFTTHRKPENPPKKSLPLAIVSFLTAVITGVEIFSESFSGTVMHWQTSLLMLAGIAAIAFFTVYGISLVSDFKLPPISAAVPVIYFIIKVICVFTSISSLALITDNVLMLAAYCVMLLFFLCFGKLYNGIDREYNFRKLQASGFASAILCFTQSIPHIVINLLNGNSYQHTSNISNISLLAYGLFTAVFTLVFFSLKNVTVTHRRDTVTTQLYM